VNNYRNKLRQCKTRSANPLLCLLSRVNAFRLLKHLHVIDYGDAHWWQGANVVSIAARYTFAFTSKTKGGGSFHHRENEISP